MWQHDLWHVNFHSKGLRCSCPAGVEEAMRSKKTSHVPRIDHPRNTSSTDSELWDDSHSDDCMRTAGKQAPGQDEGRGFWTERRANRRDKLGENRVTPILDVGATLTSLDPNAQADSWTQLWSPGEGRATAEGVTDDSLQPSGGGKEGNTAAGPAGQWGDCRPSAED